ncbi:glycosyl transferase [Anditalea andensis]|uniref:Glycosyl transferase n=1 Tax=Anditalea andensis TaxID=1048983 RepID=A0A074L5Q2_9BACT|nr:glycosyl transferase [Anditalea andensis]
MKIIFWLSFFLIFYAFIGYGIVAYLLVKIRKKFSETAVPSDSELPSLTLVIPAYNEMDCLAAKVENSLSLLYPSDKIRILFVVEGSTDGSTEYLNTIPGIDQISGPTRRGKIEAINMAMTSITTPIVVFSDANTQLNPEALKMIVRHYQDPTVAAVAGEKRVLMNNEAKATGAGEGIYWKYESFLKKMDSQLQTIVGAAGELFSIRTALFEPVEADTILDDFMISMRFAAQGYRVIYEPGAYASEKPSFSMGDEKKRKVRISEGGFQAMERMKHVLNPFRYGLLTFQYISHRVLRWAVTPFCLPLFFIANFFLLGQHWVYEFLMAAQFGFYMLAFVGAILSDSNLKIKVFFVPYYFCFMHYAVFLGFIKYLKGNPSGIWEKARRA